MHDKIVLHGSAILPSCYKLEVDAVVNIFVDDSAIVAHAELPAVVVDLNFQIILIHGQDLWAGIAIFKADIHPVVFVARDGSFFGRRCHFGSIAILSRLGVVHRHPRIIAEATGAQLYIQSAGAEQVAHVGYGLSLQIGDLPGVFHKKGLLWR